MTCQNIYTIGTRAWGRKNTKQIMGTMAVLSSEDRKHSGAGLTASVPSFTWAPPGEFKVCLPCLALWETWGGAMVCSEVNLVP